MQHNYVIDIPEDELKQFQPYIIIYSSGKAIVREGDTHDDRLFLLRQGDVNVLKQVGDRQQIIGNISAINFFGEMAVVSSKPRTATVMAVSDPVVVYAFEKPAIPAILANYKWSALLIKRMTDNLSQMNDEFENGQVMIDKLREAISQMLGLVLAIYNVSKTDPDLKSAALDSLPQLIKAHMAETGIEVITTDPTQLDTYRRKGIIEDILYFAIQRQLFNNPNK